MGALVLSRRILIVNWTSPSPLWYFIESNLTLFPDSPMVAPHIKGILHFLVHESDTCNHLYRYDAKDAFPPHPCTLSGAAIINPPRVGDYSIHFFHGDVCELPSVVKRVHPLHSDRPDIPPLLSNRGLAKRHFKAASDGIGVERPETIFGADWQRRRRGRCAHRRVPRWSSAARHLRGFFLHVYQGNGADTRDRHKTHSQSRFCATI